MTRAFRLTFALLAVAACERNVAPSRTPPAQQVAGGEGAPLLPAAAAIGRANITRTDLETLNSADIDKVLAVGPGCRFTYSRTSSPIVVVRAAEGGEPGRAVAKIHGALVALQPASDAGFSRLKAGAHLIADGLDIAISPVEDVAADEPIRKADLRLRLRQGLKVGYRGFYACDSPAESS